MIQVLRRAFVLSGQEIMDGLPKPIGPPPPRERFGMVRRSVRIVLVALPLQRQLFGLASPTARGRSGLAHHCFSRGAYAPLRRSAPLLVAVRLSGFGKYWAVEHGVPGAHHRGDGRDRQAGGRRAVAIPVAVGLGAYQPDWRLRLAVEPQTGRREVQAATVIWET